MPFYDWDLSLKMKNPAGVWRISQKFKLGAAGAKVFCFITLEGNGRL